MPVDRTPSRRAVLKTTGFALASTSLAGCISGAAPKSESDTDETTTGPASPVTVAVGPNGSLRFEPAQLAVRPGTTVRWTWQSDNHNVAVRDQPADTDWQGTPGPASKLYDTGYSYERTFDTLGTYEYYCKPHEAAGMLGEITVTENPESVTTTTTEQHATTESDPQTPTETDAVTDVRGQSEVTVAVGPSGKLAFSPDQLRLSTGTTLTWNWESDNHNIVVESQPDTANWQGTDGSATKTYNEGHTYARTFEKSGTFEYVCYPHKTAGMSGTLVVE